MSGNNKSNRKADELAVAVEAAGPAAQLGALHARRKVAQRTCKVWVTCRILTIECRSKRMSTICSALVAWCKGQVNEGVQAAVTRATCNPLDLTFSCSLTFDQCGQPANYATALTSTSTNNIISVCHSLMESTLGLLSVPPFNLA